MTKQEAIEILCEHNAWRRGDKEMDIQEAMNERDIIVDYLVDHKNSTLTKLLKLCNHISTYNIEYVDCKDTMKHVQSKLSEILDKAQ